ncbi:MAG: hypothetical protein M3N39_07675 [Pseudomonadota bacterium]|nr:hypothetical protein [Pseudomonadota bacterium]
MPWLAALLMLLATAPAQATAEPVASVNVERSGQSWTAEYQLDERAPVWVFPKSVLPRESKTSWRIATVRVLTPGVSLQRLGSYDALVSQNGPLPKRVRLSFAPFVRDIEAGYDPALAFTDGSIALYADQFKLVPMESQSAARQASRDDSKLPAIDRPTRMTFIDKAGPVLVHGKRQKRPTFDKGSTYVLFGRAEPVIGPAMTTILDPSLPAWMADYLRTELPSILAEYQKQLGPSPVGQPTLLVSWAGPAPRLISLSGSVLPGMVVMILKGDGILRPNAKISGYARWFVAHEAAHFWLGQTVSYSERSESWITEGGAELLAFRATAAADPTFDVKARLSQARTECLPFLAKGGIASAYEREGDFRAYYACGAILALAAEQVSGGNFADFVRTLIGRYGADGKVTRAEWMALLESRASRPGLAAAAAKLLDDKQSDPGRSLEEFIAVAAIADQFSGP